MKISLFCLVILFLATHTVNAESCNGVQREMNICTHSQLSTADKELNELYKQQMSYLGKPQTKERLKKAQLAWIKFRDAACLYEKGLQSEGGSSWIAVHNACLLRHTQKRVEDLRQEVSCREAGCPY